jgi:hypothetical protein
LQIKYYQNNFNQFTHDARIEYTEKKKTYEKILNEPLKEDDELFIRPISDIISTSSSWSSLFVSYQEFHLKRLDQLDLYKEFIKWQEYVRIENGFSFCHYPFLLSIDAKRKILEKDSEQQMIDIAKVLIIVFSNQFFYKKVF